MKIKILIFGVICLILISCNSGERETSGEEKIAVIESIVKSKKSALEVAGEFVEAGMNGDFKKLAGLSCKDDGPYMTFEEVKHLDIGRLGLIEKIVREEKSEVDPDDLKIVVARLNIQGKVGIFCFLLFKTPKGNKIYRGSLIGYPVEKDLLAKIAVQFYSSNKFNLKKAAKIAEYLVNSDPDDIEALYKHGYIYSLMGRKGDAQTQFKELILRNRYYAKNKLKEDDLLSVEIAEYLVNSDPNDLEAIYWLGNIYSSLERKEDAITQYKSLIVLSRDYAENVLSEDDFLSACEELLAGSGKVPIVVIDKEIRYSIAEKLFNKRRYEQAIPVMIEMWTEILNDIKNKAYKQEKYIKTVRLLTEYNKSGAVPVLIKTLKSYNRNLFRGYYADVWAEIARCLGELKDERAISTLLWAIPKFTNSLPDTNKFAQNLSEALIKLNAIGCVPIIKNMLTKLFAKNIGFPKTYLKSLAKFTGKPYDVVNWRKANDIMRNLSLFQSRASISGNFMEYFYKKDSEKLRKVTNPSNYEKIRDWIYRIKKRGKPRPWQSVYTLDNWSYKDIRFCDIKDNYVYIWVNRKIKNYSEESLITLKWAGQEIKLYDIQIGNPCPREEKIDIDKAKEIETEAVVGETGSPVRAVGNIKPPKLIREVLPVYPEIARQAGKEGVVIVEVTTDIYGKVQKVKVLRSIPVLDQAAIDAVRQYVYEPMIIDGKPRGVIFTVTVRFKLK